MNSGGARTIIGLEVHVQLNTASKLFCPCPTDASGPNTAVCGTCLGLPGSKPFLNQKAVEMAVRVALALNCRLNAEFFFSRKTYFYPDLAKNYQITQFEKPVGENGFVALSSGKKIRIRRLQLEEDPASLVHEGSAQSSSFSLVDYNRSGIPLVEIVTMPDMDGPKEAREFLNALTVTLDYLGVFVHGKNALKADANISIEGNNRVEVKNVTGFRAVETALLSEDERQRKIIAMGEKVARETRGFDEKTGSTFSMREKEAEEDYGYIFEPDIPVVSLSEEYIAGLKESLPELFPQKVEKFKKLGLPDYDARVIASEPVIAGIFEQAIKHVKPQTAAKFLTREVMGILNYNKITPREAGLEEKPIVELLKMIEGGRVGEKNAKEAMIKLVLEKKDPREFLEKSDLLLDLDEKEILKALEEVLAENPHAVADLRASKAKAVNFIVGQVVRRTKGKANAKIVQEMLAKKIKGI
ncbi:MAG: Asp-tRNA(Asn)/Glu-tRNA(Gln) amidotransferase subunit GatB [Candidatus Diapherotrites archaeon]|nr:Asp-tRNA(Asn)/Glu-tRNA(Gln) amidotransferase subunit GatB [Candidatus Diapherotrites archaeon]